VDVDSPILVDFKCEDGIYCTTTDHGDHEGGSERDTVPQGLGTSFINRARTLRRGRCDEFENPP